MVPGGAPSTVVSTVENAGVSVRGTRFSRAIAAVSRCCAPYGPTNCNMAFTQVLQYAIRCKRSDTHNCTALGLAFTHKTHTENRTDQAVQRTRQPMSCAQGLCFNVGTPLEHPARDPPCVNTTLSPLLKR
eukprot:784120-Prymnesium_polylepis.1